jgi:hypothetical protein
MSVNQVVDLHGLLPVEEVLGLGLELSYFYGPSIKEPVCASSVIYKF